MSTAFIFLLIATGIALLYYGAEFLVKGAAQLALNLGIAPLVVGLTVVSFSTSMPEAVSSFFARIQGDGGDMALGNVMGSNIANVALVLGIAVTIRPLDAVWRLIWIEIPLMLAATVFVMVLMILGPLERGQGMFLILLLAGYVWYQVQRKRSQEPLHLEEVGVEEVKKPFSLSQDQIAKDLSLVIGGSIMLCLGGYLLIEGALRVARLYEVSERVIGLSLVAVGTSLPELAVSVIAAVRKESDILIGNIVGSNLFNLLFVVGATAMIGTLDFSSTLLFFDAPVMLGTSLVLWIFMIPKQHLSRWMGLSLMALYAFYIFTLYSEGAV